MMEAFISNDLTREDLLNQGIMEKERAIYEK